MASAQLERCEIAPGFSICRAVTGLWQVADMERGGKTVDAAAAAAAMGLYVEQGLNSFDMADHYGSSELITRAFLDKSKETSVQPIALATAPAISFC
jgi:aryl-alcohol dehydrogenase-like predicted oxidoreductase